LTNETFKIRLEKELESLNLNHDEQFLNDKSQEYIITAEKTTNELVFIFPQIMFYNSKSRFFFDLNFSFVILSSSSSAENNLLTSASE
jgi:hypothetical protein